MNDNLKNIINLLQIRIVPSYESDNILLIFDNYAELLKYKRKHKYMCPNEILMSIENLEQKPTELDGMRYKRYHFMLKGE